MTPHANKELIQEYLNTLRRDKSPATMDKFISEDELKAHIAMYEQSLPGYWIEAHDLIAEDDQVFVRATLHGVHKGKLMDIQPTGKTVTVPLYIVYKIAKGKIAKHWMLVDTLALLQQIGAIPMPEPSHH